MTILLTAALLPPLVLMFVMYKQDKIEKESPGLLLKIFLFGVISCFPAIILETIGTVVLDGLIGGAPMWFYNIFMFFIVVALSEEFVKYMAMRLPTWNNPEFNYTFDAILYGAVAALGFAAFENIGYVTSFGGLPIAAMRSVTAIPGHCIFGIFMGYYYGMAKFWALRGDAVRTRNAKFMAFLVPVLLHGFYDYCASSENELMIFVFFGFIILLDVYSIHTVRKMSRMDMPMM